MTSKYQIFFSTLLVAFAFITSATAQKFGHINSQQLLMESPKVKVADDQLETYQNQLIKQGQELVTKFETDYQNYVEKANGGTLSKIQMQQMESELTAKQENIQKYEYEVQQKLAMKREELYKPILDEVKVAIDAIGKDEGYTMIFDTATNALLFAMESEDVLAKVKTKLGW